MYLSHKLYFLLLMHVSKTCRVLDIESCQIALIKNRKKITLITISEIVTQILFKSYHSVLVQTLVKPKVDDFLHFPTNYFTACAHFMHPEKHFI